MHALWVNTSYPDARIWNNRVAALAGSARSTGNLGVSAALAVSEASGVLAASEVSAERAAASTRTDRGYWPRTTPRLHQWLKLR